MDPYRAIILTALSKEYLAIRAYLDNLKDDSHKGTVYESGTFADNGRSWTVAIAQVGRHNENAAVEAERAMNHFSPKVAIFMGVAGGVHGVALGDVVAATKVYGYEAGKAKAEFFPTPEVYRSSHAMEQRAMAVARCTDWLKRIKGSNRDPAPNAFVEPIAAGPKVVKSTRSATYKFLRSNCSDAVAVEMEGLGFLAATHANSEVYALVVRGISDLINHKDEADASGSQEILAKLDFGEEADQPKSVIENIPYHRNRNFTGRSSLLDKLRKDLTTGQYTALTQAVTGLGGVGKTQLALEYAYRHIDDYEVIWWVRSEDPAILANDYIELADRLGLEKSSGKTEELIEPVRQWFENNTGWVLIFDNAQNPRELTRYLPKIGSGHVIVTSRNPNWECLAKPLEVFVFERPESVAFLLKRTGQRDEKAAEALSEALGDLPLALEQAGAYVKETGISFEDYLKRFQKERIEILRYGKPDTYPETIATTWEISAKAASKETPESMNLLNLCAYLSPDLIPRPMLVKGSEHLPDPLASTVKNDVKMDSALASLRRYSLIGFSGDRFFIHRMVQAATQDMMGEEERSFRQPKILGQLFASASSCPGCCGTL
jgi:nucleoside phosphorylase